MNTPIVIEVKPELHTTIDAACAALAQHPDVYQREGRLIQAIKIEGRVNWAREGQEGIPTLREIPAPTLAGELTRYAVWTKYDGRAKRNVPCEPPERIVAAVAQAAHWPGVRTLHGIVEAPMMRADGSILQTQGYDAATGVLYEPGGVQFPGVPEAPTKDDAVNALLELAEPFEEFPFASAADMLVPLAFILTSLAMGAFGGANFPCFILDANLHGTGKTLCAETCAWILTGREMPKQTFPSNDDAELEKILGGAALAASPMLMLDNIKTIFGGDSLEQRMTCRGTSQFRILGKSKNPSLPWRTLILASGNNIRVTLDMRRRSLRCRLRATQENPEERPIKRPDLRGFVLANRPRLVVAALTVLRAYFVAGRPKQDVGAMGNFEEWVALVASALKWVTDVDVLDSRIPAEAAADPTRDAYAAFLATFSGDPLALWQIGKPYLTRDFAGMACWSDLIPEGEKNRNVRIAGVIRQMCECPIDGRQVVAAGTDPTTKAKRYAVVTL